MINNIRLPWETLSYHIHKQLQFFVSTVCVYKSSLTTTQMSQVTTCHRTVHKYGCHSPPHIYQCTLCVKAITIKSPVPTLMFACTTRACTAHSQIWQSSRHAIDQAGGHIDYTHTRWHYHLNAVLISHKYASIYWFYTVSKLNVSQKRIYVSFL